MVKQDGAARPVERLDLFAMLAAAGPFRAMVYINLTPSPETVQPNDLAYAVAHLLVSCARIPVEGVPFKTPAMVSLFFPKKAFHCLKAFGHREDEGNTKPDHCQHEERRPWRSPHCQERPRDLRTRLFGMHTTETNPCLPSQAVVQR